MSEEVDVGCDRPAGGPVEEAIEESQPVNKEIRKERKMIRVGQKAPDFTAPAYHKGKFTSEKLSDHLGKWVVLCFYPGDFTFV